MPELLLGCGASRDKRFQPEKPWTELITLDINPDHKPTHIWDLMVLPYPLDTDWFDEVHAYEVLEHIGQQGDYKTLFAQFSEFWRILKPNGLMCATVPSHDNLWAWGDPSHTRIINEGTLTFLSQKAYNEQVGVTTFSDFRYIYKADFDIRWCEHKQGTFYFILEAIKPSRIYAKT